MAVQTKTIIDANLYTFMMTVQELIQQGWEIDRNNPPVTWGLAYEVGMVYDDRRASQMAERILSDAPPKPTREEILQRAREAKAAKKQQEQAQQ